MATKNAVGNSLTGSTGTGNFVGATSPTLITPVLGTPSSGTLTSCTGLPEAGLTLADNTTNNASTSNHGLLKKLDNNAAHYMDGTGAWSTPAGGGSSGLVFLEVLTASSSSNLSFTSDVTSTYTNYVFKIQNIRLSGAGYIQMIVSYDGGSTYKNANSYLQCGMHMRADSSTVNGFSGGNDAAWFLMANQSTNSGSGSAISGTVNFYSPASVDYVTADWTITSTGNGGGYARFCNGGGQFNDGTTPPVNAIRFISSTGTIGSGTITVYGYQKV